RKRRRTRWRERARTRHRTRQLRMNNFSPMPLYRDRHHAGRVLARTLAPKYAHRPNVVILALPRGGVPVAWEVAQQLAAPLDIFVVRKLGVPGQEELAMGAIASGGVVVLNDEVVDA